MLACLLKLQQWRQKEDGQVFEWFVDTAQKTESMYISNLEMVYFAINKYFFKFSTYMLFITLFSTTFVCKVFHFAHLISWHSHYSRME
jgi:hypothetical protein